MGDQDPLLLAPREAPDPAVGEPVGVDVVENRVDQFPLLLRPASEAEPVAVQAEGHQVAGPHGHVGVEGHLLGHVPEGAPVLGERRPEHPDLTRARTLEAEDDPQEGGLAHPVRADEPGELALVDLERDVVEDGPPGKGDTHLVDGEHRRLGHRCSVEVPWATAASMAFTWAIIQDW